MSCSSTQVTVEPGDHDQLEGNGGRGETSGFQVAGIELNVGAADIGQRLELMLGAPVEPQAQLGGVCLPRPRRGIARGERDGCPLCRTGLAARKVERDGGHAGSLAAGYGATTISLRPPHQSEMAPTDQRPPVDSGDGHRAAAYDRRHPS